MNLFRPARFLDPDLEDWVLEAFGWLMTHLGGMAQFESTVLATPSRDRFPPTETTGHDRALFLLDCVKRAMGMADWPCDLVAVKTHAEAPRVSEFVTLETPGLAAGTFSVEDGRVVIRYAAHAVSDPVGLIATFAHELSHYLLAGVDADRPGGEEVEELLTDLTVAYAGFGVFGANAAFSFRQHSDAFGQGWQSSRNGYLSERTWALALAIFLHLKGEVGAAKPWLKDGVGKLTAQAERYLGKNPRLLEPLRAIG